MRICLASALFHILAGCSSQTTAPASSQTATPKPPAEYEISYGDGLLATGIVVEDDVSEIEEYTSGKLTFLTSTFHVTGPRNAQNIAYVTSHETPSPGIDVALIEQSTPRAAAVVFNSPVIYKLAIVDWTAERFKEMPADACQGVRFLKLKNCELDESTLQKSATLPRLEGLWLTLCKVPGGKLGPIVKGLQNRLTILSLFHSGFEDDASASVNELQKLQVLGVSESGITDRFFERLQIPVLKYLEVGYGGPPSPSVERELRRRIPTIEEVAHAQ
ncbi:hypothetical protein Pan44_03080 [Caulifigura coniformis]|uniref:Leucine Rich repeats (2 copies) n=1 Tax=Caulifigura coniformis TaxID=2527983 RepID=A0A517S843_9PLAN|nr:hypothetical protein [Caulifigura coniformis]QDT52299.1 hypothetical protein Pan44_03080 [Caulifigura coniformis]